MASLPLLLLLETATGVCSVALSEGTKILSIRSSKEDREHATMLAVYIQEVLAEAGYSLKDIDGVVVSKGPGSYTGLRIGVATAKGICYTLNKPLLAIDTPLAMAAQYLQEQGDALAVDTVLIPVIDARRMEVYGAAINPKLEYLHPVTAEILTQKTFITEPSRPHLIFGDAAGKCVEVYKGESFVKIDTTFILSAQGLLHTGLLAFSNRQFEDIAYFEPFYLKEFVAKVKGQ